MWAYPMRRYGFEFRMLGLGGVGVLGFRVPNFGSRVEGLGLWDSDFGI